MMQSKLFNESIDNGLYTTLIRPVAEVMFDYTKACNFFVNNLQIASLESAASQFMFNTIKPPTKFIK